MAGAKLRIAFVAAGVSLALFASACGSTSHVTATTSSTTTAAASGTALGKAAYVKQMKTIGQSLSTSLNLLGSATTAAKAATALTKVQGDLRAAADKLHSIVPPAQVVALHAQLEKAVRDFAAELTPVITKLKAGKLTALSTVPSLKGLQEIQTASTAITAKGYKIGG
jgi:hypothetical protein